MIHEAVQGDDFIIEAARDFRALVSTPGWAAFKTMVETAAAQAAYNGHFDNERPAGFYRGFLTACDELTSAPDRLCQQAAAIETKRQTEAEIRERVRLKQPIPTDLLEPLTGEDNILRPTFGGDEGDAYL